MKYLAAIVLQQYHFGLLAYCPTKWHLYALLWRMAHLMVVLAEDTLWQQLLSEMD